MRTRQCTGEPDECDISGIEPENLHFELGLINFEHRACNTHMCPPKRSAIAIPPAPEVRLRMKKKTFLKPYLGNNNP